MRFRQIISTILVITLSATGLIVPTSAAVEGATITYLQNQPKSNAWVVMALRASGQNVSASSLSTSLNSATDIERTILAVTAANDNASNWRGIDLIAKLDATRTNNQIGNTTLINDDIFGILAYIAAGIPSTDIRISQSRDFLREHQNSDGGWSHSTVSTSDTNDTAMAISALIRAGVSNNDPVITRAVNYLQTAQNNDGGFGISPGSESDSASTAWIISALQIAGKAPASFTKNNKTPFMYLQTVQHTDGSYKWKANEGQGNATMTAYVAIALAGTGYPVAVRNATSRVNTNTNTNTNTNNTVGNNTSTTNTSNTNTVRVGSPTQGGVSVNFRIEGRQNQICQGTAIAGNPLRLIEVAASQCGYSYFIDQTSFGRYLQRLGSDQASGSQGWLYLVNWKQPSVGADSYQLKGGDYVTWYFGEFDWKPLRAQLVNRSTAQREGNPIIEVYEYDDNTGGWRAVQGATVHLSGRTAITDRAGQASFSVSTGTYEFYATDQGNIRSAREVFSVTGQSNSGNSSTTTNTNTRINRSIPLRTTVIRDTNTGSTTTTTNTNPNPPQMSFNVNVIGSGSNLGFGSLRAGQTSVQTVTLTNTGSTSLLFTSTVIGDPLFVNNLRLDNQTWQSFSRRVSVNNSSQVNVSLTVPSNNSAGLKTGDLIFWATQ